jgi:cyanate permease
MSERRVNFCFPTVLKETGLSIGLFGLFTSAPSLLGIMMMLAVTSSSDRMRAHKWHMITATALAGLPLVVLRLADSGRWATAICLAIGMGTFFGRFGPFRTLLGEVLSASNTGVGTGQIKRGGNIGGAIGPLFFGMAKVQTGSFSLVLVAGACRCRTLLLLS